MVAALCVAVILGAAWVGPAAATRFAVVDPFDPDPIAVPPTPDIEGPPGALWTTTDGFGPSIVETSADGSLVFVAGAACPEGADLATAAYAADSGHRVWARTHPVDPDPCAPVSALAVHPSEPIVYLAGGAGTVAALDHRDGDLLWVRKIPDAPGRGPAWPFFLGVDADGTTLYAAGSAAGNQIMIMAWEAKAGATAWTDPLHLDVEEVGCCTFPEGLLAPQTRRLFVAGGHPAMTNSRILAIDLDLRHISWNHVRPAGDGLRQLVISPDESLLYAAGQGQRVPGGGGFKVGVVAKIDAWTGEEEWTARFYRPPDDPFTFPWYNSVRAVSLLLGGDIVAAGVSHDGEDGLDYMTTRLDAGTGAVRWTSYYDGPAGLHDVVAERGVGTSADGQLVFVTGTSRGATAGDDLATIFYEAGSGAPVFVSRHDPFDPSWTNGPPERSIGLDVAPGGGLVFVAGSVEGYAESVVVAYAVASPEPPVAPLAVTPHNLATLSNPFAFTTDPGDPRYQQMRYDCPAGPCGRDLEAFAVVPVDDAVKVCAYSDPQDCVECIHLVRGLSGYAASMATLREGRPAMDPGVVLIPGTVIATFTDGRYDSGHTAVFAAYHYGDDGVVDGLEVWSQNWADGADSFVRRHTLLTGAEGLSDALRYSVALRP